MFNIFSDGSVFTFLNRINIRNFAFFVFFISSLFIFSFFYFYRTFYFNKATPASFSYDVCLLYRDGIPFADLDEIKSILSKSQFIINNWHNYNIVYQDMYSHYYKEYYDFKYEFLDKDIDIINFFDNNDQLLMNLISKYSSKEINFAFRGSTPEPDKKDVLLIIYKNYLHNVKMLTDENGNKIIQRNVIYNSGAYLSNVLYLDKYLEEPKNTIYLTNDIIIDDTKNIPIHIFIRGGVVNGICEPESKSIIISYFPLFYESDIFNNKSEEFKKERENIMAMLIAHEIGHCIFGMKDDYINKESIMYPVYKFDYLEWIKEKNIKIK